MNILMTADTVGGVWQYAMELMTSLEVKGYSFSLATMGPPPDDSQLEQLNRISNVTLHVGDFKLEWMASPWLDVTKAGDWLMNLAIEVKPDVVHLNGYTHASLAWNCPVLVVGHSCVLSWWRAVKGCPAGDMFEQYRIAVARGLASADMVVAPSKAMLDQLQLCYGPLMRTRVIYNARCKSFKPAPKEEFIFSAGRIWDEAKNIKALCEAAPDLDWPVYIAGPDVNEQGQACEHENVKYLGNLDQDALVGWMSRAAVYALPAYYEPFGLTVLEAAMSGCALVLGDIQSLREIWGDAAAYVPPGDVRELVFALRYLQRDPSVRRSLAARAYRRALSYRPDRLGREYDRAYRDLAKKADATRFVLPVQTHDQRLDEHRRSA